MSDHLTMTTEAKKPPRWHFTPASSTPLFPSASIPSFVSSPSRSERERELRCTLRELAALQSPATATFPLITANGDMSSYHGNWQASEAAPCAVCRRVCVRTGCRSIRVELCGLESFKRDEKMPTVLNKPLSHCLEQVTKRFGALMHLNISVKYLLISKL